MSLCAAHAEGDDLLVVFVALHAGAPEVVDGLGVFGVVPWAVVAASPFFFGAHHGFFVRGAHDDAVLVGEFRR